MTTTPGYPDGAWQGACAACGAAVIVYYHEGWGFSYFETVSGPMIQAGIEGLTAHPAPFAHDHPLPIIDSLDPAAMPAADAAAAPFPLHVIGRHFETVQAIIFAGVDQWSTQEPDGVSAEITFDAVPGTVKVRVINADGVLSDEVPFAFT